MVARIFLLLSALLWLPYGAYCFMEPSALAAIAGVASQTPTGSTELRAMYGGLQAALGTLAGLAAFQPSLRHPALVTIAFLTAGLGSARLLGVVIDGNVSAYTAVALGFEFASAVVAIVLLRRAA